MKILAIDSSAKAASVALVEDGRLLGEFFINVGLTHSQTLMPMVEDLLKNTGVKLSEVEAFAVSAGPGSFTGLRIGIASVKGMALLSDTPCVGVSTLEAMAYNFIGEDALVCAVMDARCNQLYNAIFEVNNGKITRLTPDRTISIDELYAEVAALDREVVFVGDGALLCYNRNTNGLNVRLAPEAKRFQRASSVAFAALASLASGQKPISAEALVPTYLRIPQAERELKRKSQQGGPI